MDAEFVPRYKLDSLPVQVKLNFIDLYKVEILDRLNQNVEHWKDFHTVLEDPIIDDFVKKYNKTYDEDGSSAFTVAKEFYYRLQKSDKNLYLYSSLMDFFKKYDTELYKSMCVDEWEEESFTTFNKLLIFLHDLRPIFDLENVYSRLQKYSPELGRIYDPVIQRWKNHEIDYDYAVSLLIRTFCIMIDNATYHLLNAICLSSKEGENVVKRRFPNFELFYQKNIFEDRDGIIHVVESDQDVTTAIEKIMGGGVHSPYAKYIFFGDIPPYHLMPLMYQITADSSLNLRNYQHELSEKALQGENTLICAPTGSGKTLVAINIIRHHIFEFRKEGKQCKIVFVVPSVPLVEQQKQQLEKFLSHIAKVDKIYGGIDTVDFEAFVKSVDILVLTPQILVNNIIIDYCRLEGKTPLQLDIFSLIVLDEVHHTVKDHPYAILMAEFHRQKYGDSNISIKPMPQVVGLTASVGCPKNPKSPAQIVEHMIGTCANFDARSVTRVKNNISELAEFTCKTDDDIQIVKNSDEETKKYYNYINSLSKCIENYFGNLDGISNLPNVFKDHCDISNMKYLQWLVAAHTITAEAHLPVQSQIDAYSCLDYLRKLYDALLCAQCLPSKDTSEFYFEDLGNPIGTTLEQYVYQMRKELGEFPSSKCDIYQKLIQKIKDQFKDLPESRIMIFLPQRAYCQIASKIIERDAGFKGQYIASANASREYGGCNPTQQQDALKKFKSGEIPVLFATSVADEGLDIQKCNLVIKYQYVTDNIAHVQRKGRARDLQSKSILFTCEDRLSGQETKIISNVAMINEAYQMLDNMPTSQKDLLFRAAIEKFNKERLDEEQDLQNLKNEMCPKAQLYYVLCV
uniref:Uncharacterized protein n=1 Tax=Panagrolaimus superbus TaxID=310955 RepID=A0A914YZ17_9BILA